MTALIIFFGLAAIATASPSPPASTTTSSILASYNTTTLGNSSINAPPDCNGANTYMGYRSWSDGVFNLSRCAAACTAQSTYNLANPPQNGAPAMTCQFFNSYILRDNGNYVQQVCAMYNETWSASYAVNSGYYSGTNHYTIASSTIGSNTSNPGICVAPPSRNYQYYDNTRCNTDGGAYLTEAAASIETCANICTDNDCSFFNWYVSGSCSLFHGPALDKDGTAGAECGVFVASS